MEIQASKGIICTTELELQHSLLAGTCDWSATFSNYNTQYSLGEAMAME